MVSIKYVGDKEIVEDIMSYKEEAYIPSYKMVDLYYCRRLGYIAKDMFHLTPRGEGLFKKVKYNSYGSEP